MAPQLSVVVPMYNEEAVIETLVLRLRPVLDQTGIPYEVIAVDDASTDLTPAVLNRLGREWPALRVIRLRLNAGHQSALSAGLVAARGGTVLTMDADLQDPPELIPEMLDVAQTENVDVVYGIRSDRSSDTWFKRASARSFYRLAAVLTGGVARSQSGDFRLMSRTVVDAVNSLPRAGRVLRFAVPALGFPSGTVRYRREARAAGQSKYRVGAMIRLSVDSIATVSTAPLRLATYIGLVGGFLAVVVVISSVVAHALGRTLPGWTSTVAIVSAFSALQLVCLGVIGEYLGRVFAILQGGPDYVVEHDSLQTQTSAGSVEEGSREVRMEELER